MKKLSFILIFILLLTQTFCVTASAKSVNNTTTTLVSIETLENGDYIETTIVTPNNNGDSPMAGGTITASKTKKYKNSAGTVLWAVTVTGSFTYTGSTSTCTSCSRSATSYSSTWIILTTSVSKSGNSATARATARHSTSTGSSDYSMSVTISCSANGTIS